MTPTIDVIYVNYNTTALLRASVDSLLRHGGPHVGDVVVVDNASRDADALDALPDRVRVMRSAANDGFAVAANRGAATTSGSRLLFLNPDTLVLPETIAGLIAGLDDADVVGARQWSDRERTLAISPLTAFEVPGLATHCRFFDGETARASLAHLRRRAAILDATGPVPIGALSGAVLGVRRDAFERLGGFDERYFLYWEDVDFCRRAIAAGASLHYLPHVGVIHWLEQSANVDRGAAERAARDGQRRFYRTHHRGLANALRAMRSRVIRRRPTYRARWQTAEPTALDAAFGPRDQRATRWALEIARTPLFDVGATAFPTTATFAFPPAWIKRAHGDAFYVRVAIETEPGVWHEERLFRATA